MVYWFFILERKKTLYYQKICIYAELSLEVTDILIVEHKTVVLLHYCAVCLGFFR